MVVASDYNNPEKHFILQRWIQRTGIRMTTGVNAMEVHIMMTAIRPRHGPTHKVSIEHPFFR